MYNTDDNNLIELFEICDFFKNTIPELFGNKHQAVARNT